MSYLVTVTGNIATEELGVILPHEHIVTDLRPPDTPGFGQVEADDVVAVMRSHLESAREAGVTAVIECTPLGVGRNVAALVALSKATGFPIVASAGVYRDELMPGWIRSMSDADLDRWLRSEVTEGMDGSEVVGGFIKLAVTNVGITPLEQRVLRAAGRVGAELGVTVAIHTVSGSLAVQEANILTAEGLPPERYVWVHAQNEPDMGYHRAIGERGCYLEYDGIRAGTDLEAYVERIRAVCDWGLQERVLLSQDAGWYRPGEPHGGDQRPFDFLSRFFLPLLREQGFSAEDVRMFSDTNPKRAFGRG
ncbi:MAG: esterase [Anaerolineae bacterium]|nr:esterase [Anaerolineae bacterium]